METDFEIQALVVGGGVAGLSAAAFLQEAGLDPVVVERDEVLGAPAGVVELWPDAMGILSWLGVAEDVRAAGTDVRTWSIVDETGTERRRLANEDAAEPGFVAIDYGRLRALLRDALPRDAVRTATTVRTVEGEPDRVTVAFENGVSEPLDVVIGADGVHSTTRVAVGGTDPQFRGTTSYGFRLGTPPDVDGAVERWASDGTVLRVLPADGGAWGWLTVPSSAPLDESDEPPTVPATASATDWLPAGAVPDAPERIYALDDFRGGGVAFTSHRVALAGDAARARHRLAGIGPVLALEDAAVLGDELAGCSDAASALAAYGSRRRSRIGRIDAGSTPASALTAVADPDDAVLKSPASLRDARLSSSFSGTPPTPAVDTPGIPR